MDPISALGAAASIIAVIQMTQSVGLLLRDLYKNTRDARADIERLYESIVSLEIIVKGLDDLAKESPLTHSALFENLKGPLQTIFTELEGLKEKLEVQADGKYERVKLSMRKEVKRSLKWSFQKDEIVATAARLENLKSSLTLETGVNILFMQFEQLDILGDIKKDIEAAQDSRRIKIVDWLANSLPDPSVEHNKAFDRHEETTGSWLLDSPKLQAWSQATNSFLWVHGNAGSGKSILCPTVIEHIRKKWKNEPNVAVIYWYFTFRDAASQDVDYCLRSLVTKLCSKRRDTPQELRDAYELANNGQESPSTQSLMLMLSSALDGFEHVYLFVDALDECPRSGGTMQRERADLMEIIREICSWNMKCLHILTTSRKERDIEESLLDLSSNHANFAIIAVEGTALEEDIKKYLQSRLGDPGFKRWTAELKEKVAIKLSSQADGMFRLVALQLDRLLKQTSVKGIRVALDTLPTSLDEFYDQTLTEIDEEHQYLASVALKWLAFSARPLTLWELAEATIIRAKKEPFFDPEDRFMDENTLLNMLPSGLIRTTFRERHNSYHGPFVDKNVYPYIEFAHFSVIEYLKSSRMRYDLKTTYQIADIEAHSMIAEACIAYLVFVGTTELALSLVTLGIELNQLIETVQDQHSKYAPQIESLRRRLDGEFPLLNYAGRAWSYHAAQFDGARGKLPDNLALQFLQEHSNSWITWHYMVFDRDVYYEREWEYRPVCRNYILYSSRYPSFLHRISYHTTVTHPITVVSWLGLQDLLILLLGREAKISNVKQHRHLGGPLHAAATGGCHGSARILLEAGFDVNEQAGDWATPLMAAYGSESIAVMTLLIDAGAEVNARVKRLGFTTLVLAARAYFIEGVKLLLKSGADVNAVDALATPLIAAVGFGNEEVVKLLLKSGADPNLASEIDYTRHDIKYRTPLTCAVGNQRQDIVKLLLEAGADIGSKKEPGGVYDTVWKLCQRHGYLYEESGPRKVLAILDTYLEANGGPKLEGSLSIAEN